MCRLFCRLSLFLARSWPVVAVTFNVARLWNTIARRRHTRLRALIAHRSCRCLNESKALRHVPKVQLPRVENPLRCLRVRRVRAHKGSKRSLRERSQLHIPNAA